MKTELKKLEAILFLKGRQGLEIKEIQDQLDVKKSLAKELIKLLSDKFEMTDSIYEIRETEGRYRITLTQNVSNEIAKTVDRTVEATLSKSVIETLTIIAYNQPTTKSSVERLRGVSSDYAIRKLLDQELIEDAGKSDSPGQPNLYVTTNKFLELFNLNGLGDLPKMEGSIEEQTVEMVALFDKS